jgi:hypothetical protein
MTEADMFETVAFYSSNAMTGFNTYVSVMFAYLAVAYFVGGKLTRLQATIISGLFLLAGFTAIFVCNTQIGPIAHFQAVLGSKHQYFIIGGIPRAELIRSILLPLMGLGMIASLYFMFIEYRDGHSSSSKQ